MSGQGSRSFSTGLDFLGIYVCVDNQVSINSQIIFRLLVISAVISLCGFMEVTQISRVGNHFAVLTVFPLGEFLSDYIRSCRQCLSRFRLTKLLLLEAFNLPCYLLLCQIQCP